MIKSNRYKNLTRDKAIDAVKLDAFVLDDLSDEFKDDVEIVNIAILAKPYTLGSASMRLRNTAQVVISAIKVNENAIRYIGDELLKNLTFLKDVYKITPKIMEVVSDINILVQLRAWIKEEDKKNNSK